MNLPGQILRPLIALPDNPCDCWEWRGKVNARSGYGHKQLGGKTLLAHRWVYSLFNGHISERMTIDHKCGNRTCVNPLHLEAVTQAENCRRGRGAKLTPEQVFEIRERILTMRWGERKTIAAEYGVSPALISDIKYGRAWSNNNADA